MRIMHLCFAFDEHWCLLLLVRHGCADLMAASYEAATASVGGETLSTHTWTPQLDVGQQPRAVVVLFHGCTPLFWTHGTLAAARCL